MREKECISTEAERRYRRKYYLRNREKLLEYSRNYYEEHKEKRLAYQKQYSMTHDRSEYDRERYRKKKGEKIEK